MIILSAVLLMCISSGCLSQAPQAETATQENNIQDSNASVLVDVGDSNEPTPTEPPQDEPQIESELPSGMLERMETISTDEIFFEWEGIRAIDVQVFAAAFHETAKKEITLQDIPEATEPFPYYRITLYTAADAMGSSFEHFNIFLGVVENIITIMYRDKAGHFEKKYFSDETLYWMIRNQYQVKTNIDWSIYPDYQSVLENKAQKTVDETPGTTGGPAYTGYEIIAFYCKDSFDTDAGNYQVYYWEPVFTTNNPDEVYFAGGMCLDAEGRVLSEEMEGLFVVRTTPSGTTETKFLPLYLYWGGDEELQRTHGRPEVERAFLEPYS